MHQDEKQNTVSLHCYYGYKISRGRALGTIGHFYATLMVHSQVALVSRFFCVISDDVTFQWPFSRQRTNKSSDICSSDVNSVMSYCRRRVRLDGKIVQEKIVLSDGQISDELFVEICSSRLHITRFVDDLSVQTICSSSSVKTASEEVFPLKLIK